MIVKHVNASKDDNSLVHLADSYTGTLLYDYIKERFVFVQGFSLLKRNTCVYDLKTVQYTYSIVVAYRLLYPLKEV